MKRSRLLLSILLSLILAVFVAVSSDGMKVRANNLPSDFYKATQKTGDYHMDFSGVSLSDSVGLPANKVGKYMYYENGDPEEPEGVLKAYAVQWVDGYWETAVYTSSASTIEIVKPNMEKYICYKYNTENYLPFCATYETIANIALVFGENAGEPINGDDTLYIAPVETFEGVWLRASVYDVTSKKEAMVSSVYSEDDFADCLEFRLSDSSWREGKDARVSFGLESYGYTVKIYEGKYDSISAIQSASAKDITSQVLRTDYSKVKTDGFLLRGFE